MWLCSPNQSDSNPFSSIHFPSSAGATVKGVQPVVRPMLHLLVMRYSAQVARLLAASISISIRQCRVPVAA
jgi:hypothetical protein